MNFSHLIQYRDRWLSREHYNKTYFPLKDED